MKTRGSFELASLTWFMHCMGSNQFVVFIHIPIVKQCPEVFANFTWISDSQKKDNPMTVYVPF